MNRALVDPIANAVLYEGYILYPYRPSTKNQQRWTFGGLYPESYCRSVGGETWQLQVECLVHGSRETVFEGVVRCLQLTHRQVGVIDPSAFAAHSPAAQNVPAPLGNGTSDPGQTHGTRADESAARRSSSHPPAARATSPTRGEVFYRSSSAELGALVGHSIFASHDAPPSFEPVQTLDVGGKTYQTWQEAEEREVPIGPISLGELCHRRGELPFTFAGGHAWELLREAGGRAVGLLVRERRMLRGTVEASADPVDEGLFRVMLRVANQSDVGEIAFASRDWALLLSFASTHAILGVEAGKFVSLTDPPDCWREAAAGCRNVGVWPVLVGDEGQADTMLASPIILPDDPRVASESPGDYFDGTEMDEMLTLRILTLTDHEKRAMAAIDDRAGALLARTEAMAREELRELHGTVRDFRTSSEESPHVELGS